ncbi:MAG: hypothetical protein U5L09_02030 [Bacteroidales bacterium]|nr:hypothetical protein [Bacteroidales bacterium]
MLASQACLRTGAGLLTSHIPILGYNILQTAVPEAMTSLDASESGIYPALKTFSTTQAIGSRPGIGTSFHRPSRR